jgi:hypothetical protein
MNTSLRARWVLANAIGFPLGGALGGGLARAMQQPHVGVTSPTKGALVLATDAAFALGVFGAVVGLMQWLALHRRMAHVAWWAPATAAGWAAGGALAGGLSGAIGGAVTDVGGDFGVWAFAVASLVGAAAIALLPGALQAVVIGREARWWPAACTAGMVAGSAVGFPAILLAASMLGLDLPSAQAWAIGAAVMGLVFGAITGPRLRAPHREGPRSTPGRTELRPGLESHPN